jgi:hypothetical protein
VDRIGFLNFKNVWFGFWLDLYSKMDQCQEYSIYGLDLLFKTLQDFIRSFLAFKKLAKTKSKLNV